MLKKKTRRSVGRAGRANTESLETAPGKQRYHYNQQVPKHQSFSLPKARQFSQIPQATKAKYRRLWLYFVNHYFIPAHTVKGRVLNLYKMLGSFSSGNILPRLF